MHKFQINNKVLVTIDGQTFNGRVEAALPQRASYLVKIYGSIPGAVATDPIIPVEENELELLSE